MEEYINEPSKCSTDFVPYNLTAYGWHDSFIHLFRICGPAVFFRQNFGGLCQILQPLFNFI